MEQFYGDMDMKLTKEEIAIQLDLLNPILALIYNYGETYVDELKRGRSAIYGLLMAGDTPRRGPKAP